MKLKQSCLLLLGAVCGTWAATLLPIQADVLAEQPLPGIVFSSEVRTNPLPERLFIARVDLTDPRVQVRVAPGGPDPDGDGKWDTTLQEPTKIAAREKFDFVINGDFFAAKGVHDGEGTNAPYHADQWAHPEGAAMTDGRTWSIGSGLRPALVVHTNRTVTIENRQEPMAGDWEVISGNVVLVHEGKIIPHASKARHPRTVVGIEKGSGHLIVLVVDGRKPGIAAGMTYDELAAEMERLGCAEALNLDGGGSSVMAARDAAGKMEIINQPTDGHERAVADVLGISVATK